MITQRNQVTRRSNSRMPLLGLGEDLGADARETFVKNLNHWLDVWVSERPNRSDAAIAQAVEVNASTVSHWRKGKMYPEFGRLSTIAETLGIHVWQLFDDPTESRPAPKMRVDPAEEALRALAEQLGKKIRFDRSKTPTDG